MLRNLYLKGKANISDIVYLPIDEPKKVENDEMHPLLKMIFQPDEKGNLQGDLTHYINNNTNPEVKAFIESQLMQDNKTGSNPLHISDEVLNKMRSVITDDDIARFSRNADESPEKYAYRIGEYFAKQRSENLAKNYYAKEKARLQSLGYDFD